MTDLASTSGQRYEHRTQRAISSNEPDMPTQSELPSNTRSPGQSSYGYFREPRHSSIRRKSGELKAPSVHSALFQVSTAFFPQPSVRLRRLTAELRMTSGMTQEACRWGQDGTTTRIVKETPSTLHHHPQCLPQALRENLPTLLPRRK